MVYLKREIRTHLQLTEFSYQLITAEIVFYFQSSKLSLPFKCLR